jgi:peptidoglycan/LPS O-acetylase OafA/YrhL
MPLLGGLRAWYGRADRGTLADNFSGRDNSIGLIRLILALSVVVSHANPVGFGTNDPGSLRQGISLGGMAVDGFFVLSGFLITRSALRLNIGRYVWARALRILPGLWLCLVITALVVAPVLAVHEFGSLPHHFWSGPGSARAYIERNMWTGLVQEDIGGTLTHAVATGSAYNGAFDGALWTLAYEATCYMIIGVLAVTAVLRRAPRFMLAIALMLWFVMLRSIWNNHSLYAPQNVNGIALHVPFVAHRIGDLGSAYLIYLGLPFAIGAVFQLYITRLRINDVLGPFCLLLFLATLFGGAYYAVGIPALAYGLMWFAVRAPKPLRKVGRKRDLSYGVYIYGFVVEQILVVYGLNKHGYVPYLAAALAGSMALAAISWYAIEQPALKLKDWRPRLPRRPHRAETAPEAPILEHAGAAQKAATGPEPALPQPAEIPATTA